MPDQSDSRDWIEQALTKALDNVYGPEPEPAEDD
jgi:hypothetical protein